MPRLRVHRPRHGVTLLQVSGVVDAQTLDELAHLLDGADDEPTRVVLDLEAVTALGPGGVDAIVAMEERVRAAGGSVELLTPSPDVVLMLHEAG